MDRLSKIKKIQKLFIEFLHAAYEASDGDTLQMFSFTEIGEKLGIENELSYKITQSLVDEGLLKFEASGRLTSITDYGIDEVEVAVMNPNKSTEHLSTTVNMVMVEKMINSQIQQGTVNSERNITINQQSTLEINRILEEILVRLNEIDDNQISNDIKADIETIKSQLSASNPIKSIIKTCLDSIGKMGKSITVKALSSLIISNVDKALALL